MTLTAQGSPLVAGRYATRRGRALAKVMTLRTVKINGQVYDAGIVVQNVEDRVAAELARLGKVQILGPADPEVSAKDAPPGSLVTRQATPAEVAGEVDELFAAEPR